MSEFLNEMAGIFDRVSKPAVVVTEKQEPVKQPQKFKLTECHFVMNDRMRRVRHIGMKLQEGQFIMWSCKGKGLNPTIGLNESVAAHVPSHTGDSRFEREQNFKDHMKKIFEGTDVNVEAVLAELNTYTGAQWSVYKQVKVVEI